MELGGYRDHNVAHHNDLAAAVDDLSRSRRGEFIAGTLEDYIDSLAALRRNDSIGRIFPIRIDDRGRTEFFRHLKAVIKYINNRYIRRTHVFAGQQRHKPYAARAKYNHVFAKARTAPCCRMEPYGQRFNQRPLKRRNILGQFERKMRWMRHIITQRALIIRRRRQKIYVRTKIVLALRAVFALTARCAGLQSNFIACFEMLYAFAYSHNDARAFMTKADRERKRFPEQLAQFKEMYI
ncbi:hypothetical protein SDC9_148782 [bioreactor metagenome]|uniref:Uncharacterized protein n=1 Tax=bioreactor metagenome TaxID=1076179 RepID=A0A645EJW6_9ZZZZ